MKRVVSLAVLIFAVVLINSCGTETFVSVAEMPETYGFEKIPTQEDYPDADGVAILHDNFVRMSYDHAGLFTYQEVHSIKKIFKNLDEHAEIEIPVWGSDEITSISARTIKPNGTIIELTPEDFYTEKGDYFGSKIDFYKFAFSGIEENSIIEYKYTKKIGFFGREYWFLQEDLPIMVNHFKLAVREELITRYEFNWNYKSYNHFLSDPVKSEDISNGMLVYEWTVKDMPAFDSEPMISDGLDYIAYVKFQFSKERKTWNTILENDLYEEEFYTKTLEVTPDIVKKAKELTKDAKTEKEKIEILFEFVKPLDTEDDIEGKYGNCDRKSALLYTLLKALDIKVNYSFTRSIGIGSFDRNFPEYGILTSNPILRVTTKDNDELWLYPYRENLAYGELPWYYEGVNTIVALEDGTAEIDFIPTSEEDENIHEIEAEINISKDLEVNYSTHAISHGNFDLINKPKIKDANEEEKQEFCESFLNTDDFNPKIENIEIVNADSTITDDLEVSFDFTISNPYDKAGNLIMLNFDPFSFLDDMSWLNKDKRKYPIFFLFAQKSNKKITINLPDNLKIKELPSNRRLAKKGLLFRIAFRQVEDNKIEVTQTLQVKDRTIKASYYDEVKEFFNNLQGAVKQKIILEEK